MQSSNNRLYCKALRPAFVDETPQKAASAQDAMTSRFRTGPLQRVQSSHPAVVIFEAGFTAPTRQLPFVDHRTGSPPHPARQPVGRLVVAYGYGRMYGPGPGQPGGGQSLPAGTAPASASSSNSFHARLKYCSFTARPANWPSRTRKGAPTTLLPLFGPSQDPSDQSAVAGRNFSF